ncbi:SCO family protein [Jeotgalibacillus soli]|uniref:Photosynthetic protein synthase I n=1 Tax=Jeotgalibacillus soli TaxID=889306 RepID=A0A0C2VMH2_9BACL|nr:SCO family protein [Jeotgalibacillus soli]KIL45203.1 photosynthetic protein synthase I [Jeotgalibacillus soli]
MKRSLLLYLLIMTFTIILAACSGGFQGNMDTELNDFSFKDQNNEIIALEDVKGTPLLVNFIFTNCETVCPPMTYNMTQVQAAIEAEGIEDYQILSFSVDPENDSPEALKDFMSIYKINEEKWHFLTGYSLDEIIALAKDSFMAIVADDPSSDQMIHGTSFYLVNKEGRVVNSYDGISNVPTEEIVADLKAVSNE